MNETVKFNVGGRKVEVPKSLLAQHPNTLISKSASNQLHNDPEAEIFIGRDGILFPYVLSYLRDGKVHLPITVSKQALLDELVYYGAAVIDDKAIDDSRTQGVLDMQVLENILKDAEDAVIRGECAFVAAYLIRNHVQETRPEQYTHYVYSTRNVEEEILCTKLSNISTIDSSTHVCNEFLNKAGLNLVGIKKSNGPNRYPGYELTMEVRQLDAMKQS